MVSQTRYRRYCIDVTIVLVKSYRRVIHIIKQEKRGKETKMVKRWNRPSLPLLYHCGRKSSPWNAWEEGRGRERENSWSSMRSRVSKERIFYSSNSRQRIRSSILIPSSLKRTSLIPLDILVRVEILLSESSVGDGRSWIHGWNENRSINEVTRAR